MTPLISIGIPTFNDGDVISQVLDSVKANRPWELPFGVEIVIVDNASSDDTQEVVVKYQRENPNLNIRYFRNSENIGGVKNAFQLARIATGEYLWFLCDDLLAGDALASLAQQLQNHSFPHLAQVAVSGFYDHPENPSFQNVLTPAAEMLLNFDGQDIGVSNFISNLIMKRSIWVNASYLQEIGGNSYPHTWLAMRCFRPAGMLFCYEKIYIHERLRRSYVGTPLRMLHENIVQNFKCLNQNKEALGAHYARLELIMLKFFWRHFVAPAKAQLAEIPFQHKVAIFLELIHSAKPTRKQIKFLLKLSFLLFCRWNAKTILSAKDAEYLTFGDRANGSNTKMLKFL